MCEKTPQIKTHICGSFLIKIKQQPKHLIIVLFILEVNLLSTFIPLTVSLSTCFAVPWILFPNFYELNVYI